MTRPVAVARLPKTQFIGKLRPSRSARRPQAGKSLHQLQKKARSRVLFSTKSTLTGGINRRTPMKSTDVDEIRLDGGWVDLISP